MSFSKKVLVAAVDEVKERCNASTYKVIAEFIAQYGPLEYASKDPTLKEALDRAWRAWWVSPYAQSEQAAGVEQLVLPEVLEDLDE